MTARVSVAEPYPGGHTDLHRHLDGSIRTSTLREFARADGVLVPENLRFSPGMGLSDALERFAFTLARLDRPDRVSRVASELCEDAEREGIRRLEIRFGPQLHPGYRAEDYLDAAIDGVSNRAGIIVCALYGEDPLRIEELVDLAASRPGVVGIDLAGGPIPEHRWGLSDYAPPFRRARSLGLGTTVHAGEGRPAAEIRTAIEVLGAMRIGHGTSLLDDPKLVDLVRERAVCIEACITSNWHVGVIPEISEHPIAHWLRAEIPVCICTDNTLLSDVDIPKEIERAAGIPGMTAAGLEQARRNGHLAAFG